MYIFFFRLTLTLRLLSNLPSSKAPPARHLPFLICTLSNIIWNGQDMTDVCPGEILHSLVELAFSLEPNSQYKMSLNSLLCSLCFVNTDHFSLLLANCEHVLVNGLDTTNRLLSTLAQVAQSPICCKMLLKSELLSRMISRLTNGFEKLLDLLCHPVTEETSGLEVPLNSNARDTLSYLCSLLAFFTDLMRNWTPAKLWMAREDNHRFWSPMLHFLSMDTSIVCPQEIAFVQEVAYEFFNVCLQACQPMKSIFVHLVCNALSENCILTLFLHKLLVGLVFRHDSIPVIIRVLIPDPKKETTQSLSLPLTCETREYHPSYPIGESCYLLHMNSYITLLKLDSMLKSQKVSKTPVSKASAKPADKLSHRKTPKTTTAAHVPSSVPFTVLESFVMENFDPNSWRGPESGKDMHAQVPTGTGAGGASTTKGLLFCAARYSEDDVLDCNCLTSYIRNSVKATIFSDDVHLSHLAPTGGLHDDYPLMAVMDESTFLFNAEHIPVQNHPDMFNLFLTFGGLLPLAGCLPSLYSYHWPSSLRTDSPAAVGSGNKVASDGTSRGIFRPYIILNPPAALPFHCLLMLGLCLQLESYGEILGLNPAAAFLLMRFLLGEISKGLCRCSKLMIYPSSQNISLYIVGTVSAGSCYGNKKNEHLLSTKCFLSSTGPVLAIKHGASACYKAWGQCLLSSTLSNSTASSCWCVSMTYPARCEVYMKRTAGKSQQ